MIVDGSYLRSVGWCTDLQLVRQFFRHILLQIPPLDLQRHGRRADSLESTRHLHILSLPHTHIFRDFRKCRFGLMEAIVEKRKKAPDASKSGMAIAHCSVLRHLSEACTLPTAC